MFDIVEKYWPMSEGDGKATRKKRPRILAITTDCCTGCAGSPACIEYCPIEACMFWVPDEDHPPFGRIEVDPYLCIGCQKCTSKGPDGAFLDGCPWDAIEMIPTEDWEMMHGIALPDSPPPPPADDRDRSGERRCCMPCASSRTSRRAIRPKRGRSKHPS